ncbi:DUF3293 domain-containing protein [Dyella sp.]|uniref:DUF3293 domain-containing protein n=1 Tax=Dyella sp. TaxID=1869338 RepID=UPI002D790228|nr:DUF3293 domain-containing protein [Dyella sp.]HET6432436.1 DUF3293 domain-containing protein [Dyella sp.]
MDETLEESYRQTDYHVRLSTGGSAVIHVDTPLPASLQTRVGTHPWGVITGWNPMSLRAPRAFNRAAQRALLADLRAEPALLWLRPAIGVGRGDWKEPSLFVAGLDARTLDRLGRRYRQLAYLVGVGSGRSQLRWVRYPR